MCTPADGDSAAAPHSGDNNRSGDDRSGDGALEISPRATSVQAALRRDGAIFFNALQHAMHLRPVALENALGELVAPGAERERLHAHLVGQCPGRWPQPDELIRRH